MTSGGEAGGRSRSRSAGAAPAPEGAVSAPAAGRGRLRPPEEPCLNCGDATPGRYCPTCGQQKALVQVSLGTIVGEVVKDELVLNSALPRTLGSLFFRPGRLTTEYIAGRVVRYIPPLRLYLVSSILFFLVVSFLGLRALDRATIAGDVLLPADPDSARAELLRRQAELEAVDTAALPAAARALVRRSQVNTRAALAALGEPGGEPDAEAWARAVGAAEGVGAMPPGTLQPWAEQVRIGSRNPVLQRAMERRLTQVGHLPPQDAMRAVVSDLLDYAPHMMFVLLPLFALLLKLLYIRRRRYYAEHFVFALHVHAFYFLMFFVMLALPWGELNTLFLFAMAAYLWLAMKRVYAQGWFRTTVKWWLLGWSYFFVLAFGLTGLALTTLLLG
jgi:hypothetical protein